MPVQRRLGHVGQVFAQLGRRERPTAREGVHDADPDRVKKKIDCVHVLVGHSLGGLYASRFPTDVAGLLLFDPAHEDYNASMRAGGW